jgi:hypothetical protein
LHAHARGANFNGNAIVGNLIGTNNTHYDYKDRKTTGIYLGAAAPVSITITNNLIRDDAIGIFAAGPVTVRGVGAFLHVTTSVVRIPSYAG